MMVSAIIYLKRGSLCNSASDVCSWRLSACRKYRLSHMAQTPVGVHDWAGLPENREPLGATAVLDRSCQQARTPPRGSPEDRRRRRVRQDRAHAGTFAVTGADSC